MRVLIVEDEPLLAQRLERFCHELLGERLEFVRVAHLFSQAQAWLAETQFDLLLLDLNLHGRDGMELLTSSVAGSFHTIIVSANTDQALRAFEYGVLDFVPKPFTRERLAQALHRLGEDGDRSGVSTKFLAVRKSGRIEVVPVERVVYVEGAGAYSELVLDDGRRELHDKTLKRLLAILPPLFERVHKSTIVRWNRVKALHAREGSHYEVELMDGTRLPVGRTRYKELREKLG